MKKEEERKERKEEKNPRELCISLNMQIIFTSSGKLHSRISCEVSLNLHTFQFKSHEIWAGELAQTNNWHSVPEAYIKLTCLHRLVL